MKKRLAKDEKVCDNRIIKSEKGVMLCMPMIDLKGIKDDLKNLARIKYKKQSAMFSLAKDANIPLSTMYRLAKNYNDLENIPYKTVAKLQKIKDKDGFNQKGQQ